MIAKRKVCLVLLVAMLITSCKNTGAPNEAPSSQQKSLTPAESGTVQEKSSSSSEKTGPNRPPRITSVDVDPLYPKSGDTFTVTAKASDPDNDEVTLIYQWFKNDGPLSEASNVLPLTDDFKRGDVISLLVVPDDGKDKGSPGRMTVTIGNAPPVIVSSPGDIKFVERTFVHQVKAVDKDNDQLVYSLRNAPSGMTIQSSTGLVQWSVPPDFRGQASITVSVTDGHGGEAVQSFNFEIASQK